MHFSFLLFLFLPSYWGVLLQDQLLLVSFEGGSVKCRQWSGHKAGALPGIQSCSLADPHGLGHGACS